MEMPNDFEDQFIYFPEELDADQIFEADDLVIESFEPSNENMLPKNYTLVGPFKRYPEMNCHAFTLGAVGIVNDPRRTWVNYGVIENAMSAYNIPIDSSCFVIRFVRKFEDFSKAISYHSGICLPNGKILSAIDGIVTLNTEKELADFYHINYNNLYGKVFSETHHVPVNLDTSKLQTLFGITL